MASGFQQLSNLFAEREDTDGSVEIAIVIAKNETIVKRSDAKQRQKIPALSQPQLIRISGTRNAYL